MGYFEEETRCAESGGGGNPLVVSAAVVNAQMTQAGDHKRVKSIDHFVSIVDVILITATDVCQVQIMHSSLCTRCVIICL